MRSFLRAGLLLGFFVTACKDSSGPPGDFSDPVAVSTDMQSVDSAFDSDVYRSFSMAALELGSATTGAAPLKPATTLLGGTFPKFERSHGRVLLHGALQAEQLRQLRPAMSRAAVEGRIIPDSVYGRVFQWDTASDSYTWQDSTVAGLNGVRFILYQVDEFGLVVEPTVEVGTLDVIDESTLSSLQLHILVKGLGGTPTYLDYTAMISATATSVTANANGFLSNGLSVGNKTLTFTESVHVTDEPRITANATFTLNSPARTFVLSESVSLNGQSLVITGDFHFVRPGETVQFYATLTIDSTLTISATVRVNGRTVATLHGEVGDPGTVWVDAGGDPLTLEDVAALEDLENSAEGFQQAVNSLFLPVETFFTPAS